MDKDTDFYQVGMAQKLSYIGVRFISQETVDNNNLGLDRIPGPKIKNIADNQHFACTTFV